MEKAQNYISRLQKVRVKLFALCILSIGVGLVLVSLAAYIIATRGRIAPGVIVVNTPIGNLTRAEATTRLTPVFNALSQTPITLQHNDATWTLTPHTAGISYSINQTLDNAWAIGRRGSLLDRLVVRWTAWRDGWTIDPALSVNPVLLTTTLNPILMQSSQPGSPPRFVRSKDTVVIDPGTKTQSVDLALFLARFREELIRSDREAIRMPLITNTAVSRADLEQLRPRVTAWMNNPPLLELEGKTIPLEETDILELFSPPAASPSALLAQELSPSLQFQPRAQPRRPFINEQRLARLLTDLATTFDSKPVNAVLRMEGGRVTTFRPSRPGKIIDRAAARVVFENALATPIASEGARITIPVTTTDPEITTADVNTLGINTLLGRGVSTFTGSIAGRIYNIGLSASRLSGALIPPGEEFSFNDTIGEVSSETGYQKAYIINEGRTVLDDGGGVCQTSTTLFRAILNAGLPITRRTAHAYRVGYYEQNSPPGFDATVYAPYVDLRFKNDTPAHLLIQAAVTGNTLTIEIYGTDDGRRVSITEPVITNLQKPPPPRYQDDPTLPRGQTKQVDWEAWGANVVLRRTVRRNGAVLYDARFQSNYRPWQAVYLVGSGT